MHSWITSQPCIFHIIVKNLFSSTGVGASALMCMSDIYALWFSNMGVLVLCAGAIIIDNWISFQLSNLFKILYLPFYMWWIWLPWEYITLKCSRTFIVEQDYNNTVSMWDKIEKDIDTAFIMLFRVTATENVLLPLFKTLNCSPLVIDGVKDYTNYI